MLKNFIGPLYEADKDAGTGAGTHSDVTPPPVQEPKKDKAAEPKKEEAKEPTFTKGDVDRLVEEAKASGNQKALNDFLKLIGAKDVEDAKRIADEYKQLRDQRQQAEDAAKSELDRAKSEAETARKNGETALTKAKDLMVEAEITVIAKELGARNRDHVARLMDRSGIEVDLDAATVKGVREALMALKADEATAYLFAAAEPVKTEETKAEEVKKPAVQQVPQTPRTGDTVKTTDADEADFRKQQQRQFNASF